MKSSDRSKRVVRRDLNLTLSLWLERHREAKVICVSCGIMPNDVTLKRAIHAVSYNRPLNTVVIEYYE